MNEVVRLLPSDYLRKGWCQGRYAQNANSLWEPFDGKGAVMWCLAGAFMVANRWENLMNTSSVRDLGMPVSDWNDLSGRTQEQVIAFAEQVERELGLREEVFDAK